MNYAVIRNGGKQYRVTSGDVILIEKNTMDKGSEIRFEEVIMLSEGKNIKTKTSELASAAVIGEIIEQTRGPKLTIFRKKRRQNYRRRKGHKQDLTLVRIKSIGITKEKALKTEKKEPKKFTKNKEVSKASRNKTKSDADTILKQKTKQNITKNTSKASKLNKE